MSTLKTKAQSILDEKDSKIIPENIKKDVTIFDVTGTMEEGIDTSDATATFDDIIEGKTAYIDGQKVRGTLPIAGSGPIYVDVVYVGDINPDIDVTMYLRTNNKEVLDNDTQIEAKISYSDLAKAIDLTSDKIASGESVLGMEGTYEGLDTSDATATASDILSGKTAYVNGDKITGTLEISDNSIITLSNEGRLEINCDNLANILSEQLTVEQKALQIYNGGSWQLPAIVLSYAYDVDSQSADIVGLTLGDGSYSLKLIVGSNIVAVIDEDNSGTEQYYKSVMTVQDLIDLLNAIGKKVVNLSISSTMYMYSPTSIIINGETNYEFGGTIIHKTGIINNFISTSSIPAVMDTIRQGDQIKINTHTIADIIVANTTSEERAKYIYGVNSGMDAFMILCTGTLTASSEPPIPNSKLGLSMLDKGGAYVVCTTDEGYSPYIVCDDAILDNNLSCMDISETMTLGDFADILKLFSDETYASCTWDGSNIFEFDTAISEITIMGPNLNKTIPIPTGTTIMEVVH